MDAKNERIIKMEKKKTVYLGMIGDIMHPGLINIINEGAKYGDLMIGLFTDKAIATHKRLPYLNYEQRKQVIESIKGVSSVVPQDDWSYVPNLVKYKPDYIIHVDKCFNRCYRHQRNHGIERRLSDEPRHQLRQLD